MGIGEDSASYGLALLRTAGLATFTKQGRVPHSLAPAFSHALLEHCLHHVLTISGQESSR